MAFDLHTRFHETWLGLVQPVEGLVVSIPVLVEAQCMERHGPELQERLRAACPESGARRRYRDLEETLATLLGWTPDLYDRGEALPQALSRYIAEGHQTIRPTLALRKLELDAPEPRAASQGLTDQQDDREGEEEDHDEASGAPRPGRRALTALPDVETPESLAGKPYAALVWELPAGLELDKPETVTGDWRYPPAAKFERLLRACRVPIGLVTNGEAVRLIYAPHGEATGSITFDLSDMGKVDGRPILDAFVMLLSAQRFFGVRPEDALPALLRRSRERQANVTNALAAQVFEALDLLLRGFEGAAHRDRHADLRALLDAEGGHEHLYGGLLTVLLRLVFLLYAEDRELLPTENAIYREGMSVSQLFEDLQRDQGTFPDTMSRRFGAWSRLVSLFRCVHDGVEHGGMRIPRRRGELFDPSRFPFLEGWGLPDSAPTVELGGVDVPTVDDETVYRVLERLVILEAQRLSYKVLDVEQIGSVYEALMGYTVMALGSPAVCCRHKSLQTGSVGGVWIEAAAVLEQKPGDRGKWLIETYNVAKGDAKKVTAGLKSAKDDAAVLEALEGIGLRRVPRREAGQLALQPGEERRRTSSHYTPRSLSQPIVQRTLEPLIAAMSDTGEPSSEQLLNLKVCDPAMGSGAFLVEACRFLADHVVAAWEREGQVEKIASAKEDVVTHARRLVAQRCLYGVDKNAFAVTLARLSLWLFTLAKNQPFTFVDHALRHGDSLVGLSIEQVQAVHWAPAAQLDWVERMLADSVRESLALRQRILDLAAEESAGLSGLKEKLLWDATDAYEHARTVGDLVIGAFFDVPKKDREKERTRRLDEIRLWLAEGGPPPEKLRETSASVRKRLNAFHWGLEFPEVFHGERADPLAAGEVNRSAWMDSFVGNPPFAGKNGITRDHGDAYLDWLKNLHEGSHGNADLSAHFFRRADSLLGSHGTLGLIATNTIAQGDTRASGLKPLVTAGDVIYDATRSMLWPGEAAVAVSVVHVAKGRAATTVGGKRLDGVAVRDVNSRLRAKPERPDPVVLKANADKSFQGSIVLGMGFTLTPEERDALVKKSKRNAERIFPYLGGKEVNSSPTQAFDRYVIGFGEMSLKEAEAWPDLLAIVRERVKPERDKLKNNPDGLRRKTHWWQFGRWTPALYNALAGKPRCLLISRHTKHVCFAFQPANRIFSEATNVFAFDSTAHFALLQSRVHEPWARLLSSSMRDDLRYSASDCFETFPFPRDSAFRPKGPLEGAGRELYEARAVFMVERNQGLTATYNDLKNPEVTDPAVEHLRELHLALDAAVLRAYGWVDLEVPLFTEPVSDADWRRKEAFDDEVIDRLFALNAERAAEEARLGLPPIAEAEPEPKREMPRKPPRRAELGDRARTAAKADARKAKGR